MRLVGALASLFGAVLSEVGNEQEATYLLQSRSPSVLQRHIAVSDGTQGEKAGEKLTDGSLPNLQPNLQPPSGAVWRGSTTLTPVEYEQTYGHRMHIYRFFAARGWYMKEDVKDFIRSGGIVFYSMKDKKSTWKNVPNWLIKGWARDVKSVAPHKVFVVPFFEPDLYVSEEPSLLETDGLHDLHGNVQGTGKEYREMWLRHRRIFEEVGVSNAVWSMDWSWQGKQEFWRWKATWPGAEHVDWIFFNHFQNYCFAPGTPQEEYTFDGGIGLKYDKLTEMSEEQCDNGEKCDFLSKPWGLGAFGTASFHQLEFNYPCKYPPAGVAERETFFDQAKEATSSARFEKLHAYIYFDTFDHGVYNKDAADTKKKGWYEKMQSQWTEADQLATKAAYENFLDADAFKLADASWPAQ